MQALLSDFATGWAIGFAASNRRTGTCENPKTAHRQQAVDAMPLHATASVQLPRNGQQAGNR